MNRFTWEDDVVFALTLAICAGIGGYFGFYKQRQVKQLDNNASEYLFGGGNMGTIPVGMSLLAGFLSSITLIAQPAEVYMFGPQIWLFGFGSFIIIPIVAYIFIPFFRDLNATSVYEYFGMRFCRQVQLVASSVFSLQVVLFLAMVLYAPSLSLHQVTGIDTNVICAVLFIVCIFYTIMGGVRAVIWTDSFLIVVLYLGMTGVLVGGTIDAGGVVAVFQKNIERQRSDFFNFDVDPTLRYSVWGSLFGGASIHLALFCGNQFQIQRFMSVPSNTEARKTLWIYAVGWAVVTLMTAYSGMLVFATYADCDPLTTGQITMPDQIFPYYVVDVLGHYKGMPGLFVSGIFAAGLSTVSTGVNSLAAIWFAELDGTDFKKSLTPAKANITIKLLALLFGILSFSIVFLVPYMGSMAQLTLSLNGLIPATLAGVFVLGMYVPFAESWGAFLGLVTSTVSVGYLMVASQLTARDGFAIFDVLPMSVDGCSTNATVAPANPPASTAYRISFLWYAIFAFTITVVVGVAVSFITTFVQSKIRTTETARRASVSNNMTMESVGFLVQQDNS